LKLAIPWPIFQYTAKTEEEENHQYTHLVALLLLLVMTKSHRWRNLSTDFIPPLPSSFASFSNVCFTKTDSRKEVLNPPAEQIPNRKNVNRSVI
jgi:hypothetical protein